jgi:hypothetical protein
VELSWARSAIGLHGPKSVALAVPLHGFLVRQLVPASVCFSGGMCPCPVRFHQLTLLGCRQFWLIAAEVAFRFGHLHSLSRSRADE